MAGRHFRLRRWPRRRYGGRFLPHRRRQDRFDGLLRHHQPRGGPELRQPSRNKYPTGFRRGQYVDIAKCHQVGPCDERLSPRKIRYNGAPVTVGQFDSWAPIAAEQIAGGYEMAWKMGADLYSV